MRVVKTMLGAVFTVFLTVTLVFFMVRLAPGGPFDTERAITKEQRAQLQQIYGLDKPLYQQYERFLSNIARGNWGVSMVMQGRSVADIITQAFPVSLMLGIFALAFSVVLGIPLGFWWASANKKSAMNRLLTGKWLYIFTMLPSFVAAPIAQQIVLKCGGVAYGYTGLNSLFWPALVLGLYYLPFVARLAQVGFQEESRALYLRVAQAKGLSRFMALWRHGYKAALSPVLAYLGPTAAGLVTGAFVVETVWGLPGMGRFFVNAVFNRDDTLLLGLVAFYVLVLVLFNTVIEIILAKWNPRGRR